MGVVERAVEGRAGLRVKHLKRLMLVSKHWRDVILSTPQLWCHVDAKMAKAEVTLAIRRSHPHTLRLDLSKVQNLARWGDELDRVLEQSARWKTLKAFSDSDHFEEVLTRLEGATPELMDLELCDFSDSRCLSMGEGRRLHSVLLNGITPPWDSPRLMNLTHLNLARPGQYSPTFEQISTIIMNCSSMLQSLHLNYMDFEASSSDISKIPPFALEALTEVTLDVSESAYGFFMSIIPWSSKDLKMVGLDPRLSTHTKLFDHSTNPFASWAQRTLEECPSAEINITSSEISVPALSSTTTSSESYEVNVGATAGSQPLEQAALFSFCQQILVVLDKLSCPVPIELDLNLDLCGTQIRNEVLRSVSTLRVHTFESCSSSTMDFVLSHISIRSAGTGEWLWPELRRVTFRGNDLGRHCSRRLLDDKWSALVRARWMVTEMDGESSDGGVEVRWGCLRDSSFSGPSVTVTRWRPVLEAD